MKKKFLKSALLVLSVCTLFSTSGLAQQVAPKAPYWVLETNIKDKNYSIVRFYDTQNQLIYEERLEGVHLDVKRRKNVKLLNKTLKQVTEKSLIAYYARSAVKKL